MISTSMGAPPLGNSIGEAEKTTQNCSRDSGKGDVPQYTASVAVPMLIPRHPCAILIAKNKVSSEGSYSKVEGSRTTNCVKITLEQAGINRPADQEKCCSHILKKDCGTYSKGREKGEMSFN